MVATIGSDATGQAYNINADTAAGAIAEAVGAAKLVYLTDVDGIRRPTATTRPRACRRPPPTSSTPCWPTARSTAA